MSETRYSMMKIEQTFNWIRQDLVLASWNNITFQSINTEIEATKYRLKYEHSDFEFTFITPIDEDFHQRLSDPDYYKKRNLEICGVLKLIKKREKKEKLDKNESIDNNEKTKSNINPLTQGIEKR